MKKFLKILLTVAIIIVVLTILLILIAGERSEHYYKYTETSGELEKKYTALGGSTTSYAEYGANDDKIKKFEVWYPEDLPNEKYPVVIFANGTGDAASKNKAFLNHLATWGFIVVGNEDLDTRTGESVIKTVEFLKQQNEAKDSKFCGKIDLENVGLAGHSQGGVAVFNAATKHPELFKALYAASATSSYHTEILGEDWKYDVSTISAPIFLTAGTGTFDAGNAESKDVKPVDGDGKAQGICPLWSLEENFGALPETTTKVIARKRNVDHGDSYKAFDGYMTAWFRYFLMDDAEGGKVFFGENPELSSNGLYQDVKWQFVEKKTS